MIKITKITVMLWLGLSRCKAAIQHPTRMRTNLTIRWGLLSATIKIIAQPQNPRRAWLSSRKFCRLSSHLTLPLWHRAALLRYLTLMSFINTLLAKETTPSWSDHSSKIDTGGYKTTKKKWRNAISAGPKSKTTS